MNKKTLIIDFDSTFISGESLDILAESSLDNVKGGSAITTQIAEITTMGMAGEISFEESLKKRIALINCHNSTIPTIADKLKSLVSQSITNNIAFFKKHTDDIYIISSGFAELITPVVADFGIKIDNVIANTFIYDDRGYIVGYDTNNPLCRSYGKPNVIKNLNIDKPIIMVGDGYNDYQVKEQGLSELFIAYTEHQHREKIVKLADISADSFDVVIAEYLKCN